MVWSHGACLSEETCSTGSTNTVDRQGVSHYAWEYIKWHGVYIGSACVTYVNGHAIYGCERMCASIFMCACNTHMLCVAFPLYMSAYSTSDRDIC